MFKKHLQSERECLLSYKECLLSKGRCLPLQMQCPWNRWLMHESLLYFEKSRRSQQQPQQVRSFKQELVKFKPHAPLVVWFVKKMQDKELSAPIFRKKSKLSPNAAQALFGGASQLIILLEDGGMQRIKSVTIAIFAIPQRTYKNDQMWSSHQPSPEIDFEYARVCRCMALSRP